jgi:hypothetical protein
MSLAFKSMRLAVLSATAMLLGGFAPAPAVSPATDLTGPLPICKGAGGKLGVDGRIVQMAFQVASLDDPVMPMELADSAVGGIDTADNLDLFEKLGLMEGHLMIGKALLDVHMQDHAIVHFGHPVRELYDYLKPAFAERKYPEFEADLKDLERRAKQAPNDVATTAAYNAVIGKIDGLRRTIPTALMGSPDFLISGIALMVDDAAGDLGESLSKGRVTNIAEYHDAMGFARYSDQAVSLYAKIIGPRADALKRETQFALTAFPSLGPPSRPTHSVSEVRAAAERIRAMVKGNPAKAG